MDNLIIAAQIIDGKVESVIVFPSYLFPHTDSLLEGDLRVQEYAASLGIEGQFRLSSSNGEFRGRRASPGCIYDQTLDAFILPEFFGPMP